ncbi:MAG: type II toxin-antitoxin system RelE/ParE family toxin [Planctomycetota bacterium]
MTFELVYTRRAVRDIQALDPLVRKRLGRKLLELRKDPAARSRKLSDPRLGMYRFRIGDYRVIFDITDSQIVILRVGHRREIYR